MQSMKTKAEITKWRILVDKAQGWDGSSQTGDVGDSSLKDEQQVLLTLS